ncbi:hypothetical protein TELCIR_04457 [Teladorsagia circumcincta]|uniref:Uncharacterized protein n=1 Tax=Teladorsagia circumcincta TaxID=45464 RepID=A0A2G9UTL4_TELCI|nr:hypothetical protein TELCIR_04457 [Teladorsagia circumcincta]
MNQKKELAKVLYLLVVSEQATVPIQVPRLSYPLLRACFLNIIWINCVNYMPPPQPPPNKPPRPPKSPPPPVQQQQQPQHPPPPPPKSPQRIDCDGVTLDKSTKIEMMMAILI